MRRKRNHKNIIANAILEYAVTLGIVAAVFVGMNIYMKRGIQAKLKDMTDYFISDTQIEEIDPSTTFHESSQNRQTSSGTIRQRFIGGGTREVVSSRDDIVAESRVEVTEDVVPSEDIEPPGGHTEPTPYTANPSAGLPR